MSILLGQFKPISLFNADIAALDSFNNFGYAQNKLWWTKGELVTATSIKITIYSALSIRNPSVDEQNQTISLLGSTGLAFENASMYASGDDIFGAITYKFYLTGAAQWNQRVTYLYSQNGGSTWSYVTFVGYAGSSAPTQEMFVFRSFHLGGSVIYGIYSYQDVSLSQNLVVMRDIVGGVTSWSTNDLNAPDEIKQGTPYYDPIEQTTYYYFSYRDTSLDIIKKRFNGSAFTTIETLDLTAPTIWSPLVSLYFVQGNYEYSIDPYTYNYRVLGTTEWKNISETGTPTNGVCWCYSLQGHYQIAFTGWKDGIFHHGILGAIGRIQNTSKDLYVGISNCAGSGFLTTGSEILEYQPSSVRMNDLNGLPMELDSGQLDYNNASLDVQDISLAQIFEKDDYAIIFKDFLTYQLKNVQQYYLWDNDYKGTPRIPGVDDWGTPENPELNFSDESIGDGYIAVIAEKNGHDHPLYFYSGASGSYVKAIFDVSGSPTSGVFDLWICNLDRNDIFFLDIRDDGNNLLRIGWRSGDIQYYASSTYTTIYTPSDDTWFHWSIIFDLSGTWSLIVDGTTQYGPYSYQGTPTSINDFLFISNATFSVDGEMWVDSICATWNGYPYGSPNLFREVFDYKGTPRIPGIVDFGTESDQILPSTGGINFSTLEIQTFEENHQNVVHAIHSTGSWLYEDIGTAVSSGILELWFKPGQTNKIIPIQISNGSNQYICRVLFQSDGNIDFQGTTNDPDLIAYEIKWYHIRIDFTRNDNCYFYLDGDLKSTITGNNIADSNYLPRIESGSSDSEYWTDSWALKEYGYPPTFSANLFPSDTEQIAEVSVSKIGFPEDGRRKMTFNMRYGEDLKRPITLSAENKTVTEIAALLQAFNRYSEIQVSGASSDLFSVNWKQQPLEQCLDELADLDGLNWYVSKAANHPIILDDLSNVDSMTYNYKNWVGILQWGDYLFPIAKDLFDVTYSIGSTNTLLVQKQYLGHKDYLEFNDGTSTQTKLRKNITSSVKGNIEFYIGSDNAISFLAVSLMDGNSESNSIHFALFSGYFQYFTLGTGWTVIQSANINQWYRVRIEYNMGVDWSIYIDGTFINTYTGFYGSPVEFDYLQIRTAASISDFVSYIDGISLTIYDAEINSIQNYNDNFYEIEKSDDPQTASIIEVNGGLGTNGERIVAIENVDGIEGKIYSTTNPSFNQTEANKLALELKTQKSVEILQVRGKFGPEKPFQWGYRTLFSYPFDPININEQFLAIIQKVSYEIVTGINSFLFSDAIVREAKSDTGITSRTNQQLVNAVHAKTNSPDEDGISPAVIDVDSNNNFGAHPEVENFTEKKIDGTDPSGDWSNSTIGGGTETYSASESLTNSLTNETINIKHVMVLEDDATAANYCRIIKSNISGKTIFSGFIATSDITKITYVMFYEDVTRIGQFGCGGGNGLFFYDGSTQILISSIVANTIYHWTCVFDATNDLVDIYINGVYNSTQSLENNITTEITILHWRNSSSYASYTGYHITSYEGNSLAEAFSSLFDGTLLAKGVVINGIPNPWEWKIRDIPETSPDYDDTDMVTAGDDTSYHLWDISAIVGKRSVDVIIHIDVTDNVAGSEIWIKKNGHTYEGGCDVALSIVANQDNHGTILTQTCEDGCLQLRSTPAPSAWTSIELFVYAFRNGK